jgi:two-component system OmpR family response regulator
LAEDGKVLAHGIRRMLEVNGMSVDMAYLGKEADLLIQRQYLAAVVPDIGFPGLGGFEVPRRLRARGSDLPVLLLTRVMIAIPISSKNTVKP